LTERRPNLSGFRLPIRVLYSIPDGADDDAMVMLSDILPTGYECGVLKGCVKPGDTVAIIGAGPIGLSALLTTQFYAPSNIIVIDLDDNRLEVAKQLGASEVINSTGFQRSIMPSASVARCAS
jgi:alcohol dehydrogenase